MKKNERQINESSTKNEKFLSEKIEALKIACRERGMRVTDQRVIIFEEVVKSCSHPDAETVFQAVRKKIPTISFDTVYRTLASLEELGMIFRVDNQLPKARFDADRTPHHHFICIKCNEVFDVFLNSGEELSVPENTCNFGEIKDMNLQIRGICNNCKNVKTK